MGGSVGLIRTRGHAGSVRNQRPFLLIPYEYEGVGHAYEPDFIVHLNSGVRLVLEVKGWETDDDQAKHQAAQRWCSAVNNWGGEGTWRFHVCRDPQTLGRELRELAGAGAGAR